MIRWRALGVVLRDAWPWWIGLAGFGLAIGVGRLFLSVGMSPAIRYAGTVLEVLGIVAVAWGLRRSRKQFGAPSILQRGWAWFGRLFRAFRRPEPITLQASSGGVAVVGGEARLRVSAGPGATVERRLELLETNVRLLEDELDRKVNEVSRRIDTMAAELGRESAERRRADDMASRQIQDVAIGDFQLQVVGLVWLALGVVGANIPDELKTLFSFIGAR